MLDIMRKKKRMQHIVLWIVIIAVGGSMVVWGVAIYGGGSNRSALGSNAAVVDGRPISMKEFLDAYNQSIRSLRGPDQTELDPEILKSLGLSMQVLSRLVQDELIEILAERLGLTVSEGEVRQAILSHPELQVDGKFIGLERYKQLLAMNGIPVEAFEDDLRHAILAKKMTATITDSLEISERELREEFSRTNQTATVDYVLLEEDSYRKRVKTTDADLKAYFEENMDNSSKKQKRRARYLLIQTSQILPKIKVSEEEIKSEWDKNPLPETVEAAHILFLVSDPSEEAEVRSRAEAVLKRAQAGEDFAALARQYSEDTSTADQGGYVGTFPRGQMSKEFEDAAFSMKPGEISGLVHTRDYGFHIIKVFRHDRPTLESNRSNILTTIQFRKAKEAAKQKAEEAAKLAVNEEDLSAIVSKLDIQAEIKETDLFNRDENPYAIGISQALCDDIFEIKEIGLLGKVVEHPLGFAFAKLEEVQMPRPGQFEESREQVKSDFVDSKAEELMQAEATKLSDDATRKESLVQAAKELGFSIKTSPVFNVNESPGPEILDRNAFNRVAFELDVNAVSEPIAMSDTVAVLQVKSRSPFDEAAFEQEREALRNQMLTSLQSAYLQDYITSYRDKLEESGKIRLNPQALDQTENLSF
jgi:peptidyl-prolyl cis-trans isomerase D